MFFIEKHSNIYYLVIHSRTGRVVARCSSKEKAKRTKQVFMTRKIY